MYRISGLLLVVLLFSTSLKAQGDDAMQRTGFIIISASRNYATSKKIAEQAAEKLSYKLDLRGLQENNEIGLSFSKTDCDDNGWDFPACVQRGRGLDNKFVSVEYTNNYEGFTKGLYIVVVASFPDKDPMLKSSLNYVKKFYKNAYIKYANVYMGCLH